MGSVDVIAFFYVLVESFLFDPAAVLHGPFALQEVDPVLPAFVSFEGLAPVTNVLLALVHHLVYLRYLVLGHKFDLV
jgi:hypothetical protein